MQREGYSGLPHDDDYGPRHDDLDGEEEGRAIAVDMDDGHVSLSNKLFWFRGSSRS